MTYEDVFDKYFAAPRSANYYNMFEHLHETLDLYIHIMKLMTAFNCRDEEPTYNKLATIIGIYSDSYMIKLRQLLTTNPRENSLLYKFYLDLLAVESRAYYQKEYDWLRNHYVNGPVDRYQKLEIHSNIHIKHYKRTNVQYHAGKFYVSYRRDPISFTYIPRTEPYLNSILRTILNFRRRSGIAWIGYSPIQIEEEVKDLESTYGFSLHEDKYKVVYQKVAKINSALYDGSGFY